MTSREAAVVEAVTDTWARLRGTARGAGVVPALTELRAAVCAGALPCGPGGHALVPTAVADGCDVAWANGRVVPRAADREDVLTEITVSGGALVALRNRGEALPDAPEAPVRAWTLGLAWVRLGLSDRLMDACMVYLGGRTVGGGTLLNQQMVKGALAEVAIEHLEIETMLGGAAPATSTTPQWRTCTPRSPEPTRCCSACWAPPGSWPTARARSPGCRNCSRTSTSVTPRKGDHDDRAG